MPVPGLVATPFLGKKGGAKDPVAVFQKQITSRIAIVTPKLTISPQKPCHIRRCDLFKNKTGDISLKIQPPKVSESGKMIFVYQVTKTSAICRSFRGTIKRLVLKTGHQFTWVYTLAHFWKGCPSDFQKVVQFFFSAARTCSRFASDRCERWYIKPP